MTVKLRKKKLAEETYSLYLDIYDKGYRKYEFLDIKIIKAKTVQDRQTNKENLELANKIRAKREHELNSSTHGIVSAEKQNVDFILYFERFNETYNKKDIRMFQSALKKLKEYVHKKNGKSSIPASISPNSFCRIFVIIWKSSIRAKLPMITFRSLKE